MKKIGKLIGIILAAIFFNLNVNAADLSISANTSSVTVGGNVVVTVRGSDIAGRLSLTSSNGSVLSGGASSFWIDNNTVTYTFKAVSAGSATITVNPVDVADYSGNVYSQSKSITVTVRNKVVIVLSGDSSLSSLSIDGATLSPEFNKDTLEYTTELQPDTTKINVVAEANHRGASISGTGEKEVSDGDNRIEIVVTAENGTTSTYVVNAKVKEFNPIEVLIDGATYTVVRKKSTIVPPENYTETTVTINNEEVPAYYSDITKYTLVSLKDTSGKQNFYIYQDGTYKLYKELNFNQMKICLLDMPNVPENYQNGIIVYNDENINAYKTSPNSSYALLYGMNVATGEENYYLYESTENTIQIYNREEIDVLNLELQKYTYIIIGLLGLSFVLLLILTILAFCKKTTKKEKKEKIEEIEKVEKKKNKKSKKKEESEDMEML